MKVVPLGGRIPEPNMGMRLDVSQNLTSRLGESLHLDISGLNLDPSPRVSPSRSPVATRATPARLNVVTSTPGMEVDVEASRSGTESGLTLPESDGEGGAGLLERQMRGLGLEGCESGGDGEEGIVEVMMCRVTTKTMIVFVGSGGQRVSLFIMCVESLVIEITGAGGCYGGCGRAFEPEAATTGTCTLSSQQPLNHW